MTLLEPRSFEDGAPGSIQDAPECSRLDPWPQTRQTDDNQPQEGVRNGPEGVRNGTDANGAAKTPLEEALPAATRTPEPTATIPEVYSR